MAIPYEFDDMIDLSEIPSPEKQSGVQPPSIQHEAFKLRLEELARSVSVIKDILDLYDEYKKEGKRVIISPIDLKQFSMNSLSSRREMALRGIFSNACEQAENCAKLSQLQAAFAAKVLRSSENRDEVIETIMRDQAFFDCAEKLATDISRLFGKKELAEIRQEQPYSVQSFAYLKETFKRSLAGDIYTGYNHLYKNELTSRIFKARLQAGFLAFDTADQILDMIQIEIHSASIYNRERNSAATRDALKRVQNLNDVALNVIDGARLLGIALDRATGNSGLKLVGCADADVKQPRSERKKYSGLRYEAIGLDRLRLPDIEMP